MQDDCIHCKKRPARVLGCIATVEGVATMSLCWECCAESPALREDFPLVCTKGAMNRLIHAAAETARLSPELGEYLN